LAKRPQLKPFSTNPQLSEQPDPNFTGYARLRRHFAAGIAPPSMRLHLRHALSS
jgi:hypothetical protein